MSPAEHYAEAERLLGKAAEGLEQGKTAHHALAAAQVHATLATVLPRVAGQAEPRT